MCPLSRRCIRRAAALLAALAPLAAGVDAAAAAPAAQLRATTHKGAVVISLVGVDGRHVTFSLAGRTLARFRTGPYLISLNGVRARRGGTLLLAAREAGTGRTIDRLRLAYAHAGARRPPIVAVTESPDPQTVSTTARVSFAVTGATRVVCRVDGRSAAPCTSPVSYSGLQTGTHSVAVIATRSGLRTAATTQWSILPTPAVSITSGPGGSTSSTSATFDFSASGADTVTCSLDGAAAAPCTSPVSYSGLVAGTHTLTIAAANAAAGASTLATWSVGVTAPSSGSSSGSGASPTGGGPGGGGSTAAPVPAPTQPAPAPPAPDPVPTAPVVTTDTPAPPSPPISYPVPAGAVSVSTSSQLQAALADGSTTDIVLADGVYDAGGPFVDSNDDRIYAAHLGGAVFHTGLVIGGNWGPGNGLVEGVAFDVSDPAKTFEGAVVQTWGASGRGARILDLTVEGHGAVDSGIRPRVVDGLVIRRVQVHGFQSYGVIVDMNDPSPTIATPPVLEDVDVSSVSRPTPRSSNGTAEACLWVGNTATVRRVRVRDCAWTGIWTGTANTSSSFSDIDVDGSPTGLYFEHYTTNGSFSRMHVGPDVATGVTCEWADPAWGSRPGCSGDTISSSTFDTTRIGVYLDEGTNGTSIAGSTFLHQTLAGIVDYRGSGNSYAGNSFGSLGAGAVQVTQNHL